MELSDRLKTGVDWQDAQHREFISRIERLMAAMDEGRESEEISGLFDFLGAYVLVHFGAEEVRMEKLGFKGMESHLLEHDHFKYELDELLEEFREDGATQYLAMQIKRRLLDWFVNHIGGIDQMLGGFLLESDSPGPDRS
ncbi:MAG: bacteriohemerythrin [Thermodesulfobacteriota bacterium]